MIHIGILSTGQELLKSINQLIHRKFAIVMQLCLSRVLELNCKVTDYGIVPDDPVTLEERLHHALEENDVVLITGGASKGKFDYETSM